MFWQKSDFFIVGMHMCYATQLKILMKIYSKHSEHLSSFHTKPIRQSTQDFDLGIYVSQFSLFSDNHHSYSYRRAWNPHIHK